MTSPNANKASVLPAIVKPTPTIINLNMNPKHRRKSRGRYRLDTPPKLRAVAKGVFSGGCFGYVARSREDERENGEQEEQAEERASSLQETEAPRELHSARERQKYWLPRLQDRLNNGPRPDGPVLVWVPEGPNTEQEMERQSVLMREDFERFGCSDKGPMVIWLPNEETGVWRGSRSAFERQISAEEGWKVEKANEKWKLIRDVHRRCACLNGNCTRSRETPKFPPGLGFCQGEGSNVSSATHTLLASSGEAGRKGHSRGSSMTNNASTRTSADVDRSTAATSVDVTRNPSSTELDILDGTMMSGALAAAEVESEAGMDFSEDERRVLGFYNDGEEINDDDDDNDSSDGSPSQDLCQDEVEERKLFGGRFYDEKRKIWQDWKKRTGIRHVDMGDTIGFLVRTGSRAKCGLQRTMSKMSRLSGKSIRSRRSGKTKEPEDEDFELSETMTSALDSHAAGPSASNQHLLSSEPTQDADSNESDDAESQVPSSDGSNVSQAGSSNPPDADAVEEPEPSSPESYTVKETSMSRSRFAEFKQVLAHTGLHWSGLDHLTMTFKKRKTRDSEPGKTRDRSSTL
ncbi:MAG: hypothetical protein M1836_001307 [Candelina mexicana]|nr:MAG: hypothetical protein M1836_001307 [Candelina mexicana]